MGNVAIAFLLTLLAGLSTGIGSLIAFLAKPTNTKFLAISLGFSAGVMIYVSMIELMDTAKQLLTDNLGEVNGSWVTVAGFFGGILVIALIDKLVPEGENPHEFHDQSLLDHKNPKQIHSHKPYLHTHQQSKKTSTQTSQTAQTVQASQAGQANQDKQDNQTTQTDQVNQTDRTNQTAQTNQTSRESQANQDKQANQTDQTNQISRDNRTVSAQVPEVHSSTKTSFSSQNLPKTQKHTTLFRMGVVTALVIAIHNFPEGLATFVAALQEPKIAIPIAVAIAIHNIPEGITVAVPIYQSTGSKKKALTWSFASGFAEPAGAIIGYLLLSPFLNDITNGVIFAAIAGIMVFISLDELLPAAHEYDDHHLEIYGLIAGMAIMAISLLLFI